MNSHNTEQHRSRKLNFPRIKARLLQKKKPNKSKLHVLADWLDSWHVVRIMQALSSFALIGAIVAFAFDIYFRIEERAARQEERVARMWQLATEKREGNSGKIPALEFLHKQGHSLQGINISKAYLRGIELPNAQLRNADLSETDLRNANLAGANMWKANLAGANMYEANLADANLRRANLAGALLLGANLAGANLGGANLTGANLHEANLAGADLWGANLAGANLDKAILTNTFIGSISFYDKDHGEAKNLTQEQLDKAWTFDITLPSGLDKLEPPLKLPDDRICKNKYKDQLVFYLKDCEKQAGFRKVESEEVKKLK